MVAVNSTMLALGKPAPDFQLPNTRQQGQVIGLADYQNQPLLIMFICNHCPYVLHLLPSLSELANAAQRQGIGAVAISANDVEHYPQDGPEPMRDFAQANGFEFPYLYDESQQTAIAYEAACTPDFFLFDAEHRLRYRGQMDGARPSNDIPADGSDLQAAIDALLTGQVVSESQIPSIGCNIKWKPGNAPDYF